MLSRLDLGLSPWKNHRKGIEERMKEKKQLKAYIIPLISPKTIFFKIV